MQLVITEDVRRVDGSVKYAVGAMLNFPRATWEAIARVVGGPLDSFTRHPQADPPKKARKATGRRKGR